MAIEAQSLKPLDNTLQKKMLSLTGLFSSSFKLNLNTIMHKKRYDHDTQNGTPILRQTRHLNFFRLCPSYSTVNTPKV